MGMGREAEKGDEFELNLELSIGGGYGKTEDSKGKITKFCQENVDWEINNLRISRSKFPSVAAENVRESMDLQRRKEIQALRRQEARRKREEKIKKSRGQNGLGFSEDALFLEAQKLQARVLEREARERESSTAEKARKNSRNCGGEAAADLSLSLFTDNNISGQRGGSDCLYPKVQQQCFAPRNGVFPPEKNENSSVGCDSEHSNGINDRRNGNRSWEQCSSAVSDYQSISYKGGNSSDTGSHSSRQPRRYPTISRNAVNRLESHDSFSQAQTDQVLGGPKVPPLMSNPRSKPDRFLGQADYASSTAENPLSRETSGLVNEKPLNPPNNSLNAAASVPRMPCVSATGNGPNGRTVMGFLYRYTKMEVSIVCVCHGSSFSPAGFVEHAGGVDISQPLKHITIVPTVFG